ncbi:L-aspartate oxidase [Intrasporangium oryzae NRRL B-24470]|uniref:L-aspartate oxidase n=1 Tax=Intrasporangium oryzae NRRL B-24470 TaxID=1386089 RepID=W9GBZ8_9MICO|nr:L-aspartate oxidase [Intrasporangium oryzae]EWT03570.1 L-aspartate oxidase [Intrasporangium oryzae NRRL B-24470]
MSASGITIPRRLRAPAPGWTTTADVIVVGSGIAGLTTALRLRRRVERVLLVTKTVLDEGSTAWAQGGIAAVMSPEDSPAEHVHDTLVAGVGLCDVDAVETLVREGTDAVWDLIALGAEFDRGDTGKIALTREGGHHRDRILHAGGDATGREISRALIAALHRVIDDPGIEVIEHALVVDLLTDASQRVCGVTLHVIGEGQVDGVGAAHARAVVLATGGLGQIYASTTNPPVATGDGMAAALRAGAELADLEFVQFHPTVLWLGEGSRGQQPLISEAVRGEGAFLVDEAGVRFMQGQHELADLAPRDVVSRAILARMRETGTDHVYLDCRHLGAEFLEARFPSIVERCRQLGFDPATQLLPVAPAQHYASGGIRTDLNGRSSLEGLYACGETSCTGVHGANRLASNSLLEGLVFARRIADDLTARLGAGELPETSPVATDDVPVLLRGKRRLDVQRAMTTGAGTVRSAASLAAAEVALAALAAKAAGGDDHKQGGPKSWETTNLLLLGRALTYAAGLREETRGGHVREDFPARDDARFLHHTVLSRSADGLLVARTEEVPRSNLDGLGLDEQVGTPARSASARAAQGSATQPGTAKSPAVQHDPTDDDLE